MATFDPPSFASLLKKAIGSRTAKQFAAETGLSESYVSRRMTGLYATPPRKNTLTAIASSAQNGVTLRQLLDTCGYEDEMPVEMPVKVSPGDIRMAKASILSCINDLGVSFRISADDGTDPCDFKITLDTDPPVDWLFFCVPPEPDEVLVEKFLKENYLTLMYSRLETYSKVSLVTENPSVYSLCTVKKPVNLNVNVTVKLCDPETLDVIREEVLSESGTSPLPEGKCAFEKHSEQPEAGR